VIHLAYIFHRKTTNLQTTSRTLISENTERNMHAKRHKETWTPTHMTYVYKPFQRQYQIRRSSKASTCEGHTGLHAESHILLHFRTESLQCQQ